MPSHCHKIAPIQQSKSIPVLHMKNTIEFYIWYFLLVATSRSGKIVGASCHMCENGAIEENAQDALDLEFPTRVIPFFNLPDGNNSPTCLQVAEAALAARPNAVDCRIVQEQATYCGCPNATWSATNPDVNACSLCPDGSKPSLSDIDAPSGDACIDMDWYLRHLSPSECNTARVQTMQGFGHYCGCAGVEPLCSWCASQPSLRPPYPSRSVVPGGATCGELASILADYTLETCQDDAITIQWVGAKCGCPDTRYPVWYVSVGIDHLSYNIYGQFTTVVALAFSSYNVRSRLPTLSLRTTAKFNRIPIYAHGNYWIACRTVIVSVFPFAMIDL
jgi:hypothetical protein